MSLQETTAFKVISLFTEEKPAWTGNLQCVLNPANLPIVGGYYMISNTSGKRFKTKTLYRENPGITFYRLHGQRTALAQPLRDVLPTLGNNISRPKSTETLAAPYGSAMRAFFRPPNKFRTFTFQKKRYKVIMKDSEPHAWRWDFDQDRYYEDIRAMKNGKLKSLAEHTYYSHFILPTNGFLDNLFDTVAEHFPTEYDNYTEDIFEPEGFSPNQ